jgi:hypothetical protein
VKEVPAFGKNGMRNEKIVKRLIPYRSVDLLVSKGRAVCCYAIAT